MAITILIESLRPIALKDERQQLDDGTNRKGEMTEDGWPVNRMGRASPSWQGTVTTACSLLTDYTTLLNSQHTLPEFLSSLKSLDDTKQRARKIKNKNKNGRKKKKAFPITPSLYTHMFQVHKEIREGKGLSHLA